MATFSSFWISLQKPTKPRQVVWLCGTEPVLIEDLLDAMKSKLDVAAWNLVSLRAGQDDELDIWAALEQHGLDDGNRLIVIRSIDRLKDWDRWIAWVDGRTRYPRTHVVAISDLAVAPTIEVDKRRVAAPIVDIIRRRSGAIVECKPFTQATAKHAVAWVQSKVAMRDNVAGHLLNRADGNLRLVRDLCLKLAALGTPPSIPDINALLSDQPRESFIDALLARKRREAAHAAALVHPDEYSRIIGQLDASLDFAGLVYDMTSTHASRGEIVKAAGSRAFLLSTIEPISKFYNPARRLELRTALAEVDRAVRGGVRDGILELLIILW